MHNLPSFVDVFLSPVRDNPIAQAAIVGLLILIVLDWVFGIGSALAKHAFSSEKMREGIGHKSTELGFVLVGIIADGLLFAGLDVGFNGPVLVTIVGYLCIMEIGSLLEHFADMNPQMADSIPFHILESAHVITDHEEADDEGRD